MPFAQVNDLKLAYEIEGQGPPLLMIAGTGGSGAKWRTGPSARIAAAGYTVITYDHRGVGKSDKPDVPYSTRLFAADAVGLLDALKIKQAHVFGHSMGGRVAQWVALDNPDRVRSLILSGTGPGEIDSGFKLTRGIPLDMAVELIEKGYEGYMRAHVASEFFFTPEYVRQHPEVVKLLYDEAMANRPPVKLYLRHVIARQEHQTAEILHTIKAPTLVIVGASDQVVRGTGNHFRTAKFLADHIPGAEFKAIEGGAHAYFWEQQDDAVAAVLDFLQRH